MLYDYKRQGHHYMEIPFKAVLEETNDIVLITSNNLENPTIIYVNKAFEKLTGYTKEEAIGQTPRILQGPKTCKVTLKRIKDALLVNKGLHVELLNYHKNGDEYWLDFSVTPIFDEKGSIQYFAAIERDITETKKTEEKLHYLANIDPLTGVFNRRRFYEAANEAIGRMHRDQVVFGLMLIDIDDFKKVNDNDGHLAGDEELKNIAEICKSNIREIDYIGSYGGDKFLFLLQGTYPQNVIA